MKKEFTKAEIVKLIIEEDISNYQENDESIHLLIDKTVSQNINKSHHETYAIGINYRIKWL